jgi:hypothetical protein
LALDNRRRSGHDGWMLDAFTYFGHCHVFANAITRNLVLMGAAASGNLHHSLRCALPPLELPDIARPGIVLKTFRRAELRQETSARADGGRADLVCRRPYGGATPIDLTVCATLLHTKASGQSNANSRVMPEPRSVSAFMSESR